MGKIITVHVPDTIEGRAAIAGLIGVPGVRIETGEDLSRKKYVSLHEGANIAGVNYFTFRRWVVEEKKIPYERPSGATQGGVRLTVENIEAFLEGRLKKKGGGRKGKGGVSVLD